MARPKIVQTRNTFLVAGISEIETNIVLNRLEDIYGEPIEAGDITHIFGTFAPGTADEEIFSATGFTRLPDDRVQLTGVVRGRAAKANYTSGGTAKSHGGGTIVTFSNNPQVYDVLMKYMEDIALLGAPPATEILQGLVQIATTAEINSDTLDGDTTTRLAVNPARLAASKYGLRLPSAAQKDGLAAGSTFGTPGPTNKFVTEQFLTSQIGFELGTGANGALEVNTGIFDIDLGGQQVFIRNYTNIAITGTGRVRFINPHANGTFIWLKVQGAVVITSTATAALDASGCGSLGGVGMIRNAPGFSFNDQATLSTQANHLWSGWNVPAASGTSGSSFGSSAQPQTGGAPAVSAITGIVGDANITLFRNKLYPMYIGCGGGGGGAVGGSSSVCIGGNGGRGGGCILITAATWEFTTTNGISVAGLNGADSSLGGTGNRSVSGGGGGGGGDFAALVGKILNNSGTVIIDGGAGGLSNWSTTMVVNLADGGGSWQQGFRAVNSSSQIITSRAGDGAPGRSIVREFKSL